MFSVIMPVYNGEKFIDDAIHSVCAQTYDNWELIIVNDGSKDNTADVLKKYEINSQIKIIHKENGGLVSARQAGIKIAKGDYVYNLDSDDAISEDALLSAYEIIKSTDAEIVSFSYIYCKEDGQEEVVNDLADEGLYNKEEMEKYIYPKLLSDKNMEHLFYFLSGRAVKRTLLTPYQLTVSTSISQGEDISCIVPCFLEAERVYMSKKAIYRYTVRNDSLSTSFNTKQIMQIAETIEGLRKTIVKKSDDFDGQLARYSCYMCFAILAAAAEGNHFKSIKEIKNTISNSLHMSQIKKAKFEHITLKSRIGIFLMKRQNFRLAFYFLYLCKEIKRIVKKG